MRQAAPPSPQEPTADTLINGLTFLFAATSRDLDNLVTKELHADPNLHKNNPNVQLVGDYSTNGHRSIQFSWTWRWKPPRAAEERAKGWRNCCSVSFGWSYSNLVLMITVCGIRPKEPPVGSTRHISVLGHEYVAVRLPKYLGC